MADDYGDAGVPALMNSRARKRSERTGNLSDDVLVPKFKAWDSALEGHWSTWVAEAKEAYDVTSGRQWDKDAEEAASLANLTTIAINKVDATVSAICGSEMTNRQEVRYYPREISTRGPDGKLQDVAVNEIFTAAAEWIRDECDAADEESEAFRDCVICGIGVTETRMDYETDPEGVALITRIDPLQIRIDSSAVRPNAADAQYIRRRKPFTKEEAKLRFGVVGEGGNEPGGGLGRPHRNWPGSSYMHGDSDKADADVVWITEYQWFDLEKVWRVLNPATRQIEEIEDEQFQKIMERMPEIEDMAFSVKLRRYYRAFVVDERILEATPLPDDEFTYKFITGKYDRNRGVWYGVVRAMIEPQRLLNKQVSQIQRIIDNNAKGGLLAEVDAFEDPEKAKQDWAASDTIVYVKGGTLGANPRVIPKPISQYPNGMDKLLAIANEAVPGVSGVNNEMLGLIDREQAGVVDVQRKEAAYGVLKAFFNSLRRYRKMHGRHLLKLIQKYMTDDRLVRIVGRNGNVQYLPLTRDPNVARYDVIVDEAPTGPNQKEKVFQFLTMFGGPILAKMNLPPQIMLKFLEFSPLPTALVAEIMQMVSQMPPQPNPEAEKAKGDMAKIQADMQAQQLEMQMEQQRIQMEAQAHQMKMQAEFQKVQAANAKLEVENKWVQIDAARAQMEQQSSFQEAQMRARETALRERNDTAKIDADIQKSQAETEIKRMELEIKRMELELRKVELGMKGREIDLKEKQLHVTAQLDVAAMEQANEHAEMDFEHRRDENEAKERIAAAANKTKEKTAKKAEPEAKPEPKSSDKWGEVSKGLSALTEAMNKPRKIVRDKNGRAQGIE